MDGLSKIEELRERLRKADLLYTGNLEDTDTNKIKLLEVIGDLEGKIREEEYKERLIRGEE